MTTSLIRNLKERRTVLWGARRGDVQYASRDFWRNNLPFGVPTITVDTPHYFDVGARIEMLVDRGDVLHVVGKDGRLLAVVEENGWATQP